MQPFSSSLFGSASSFPGSNVGFQQPSDEDIGAIAAVAIAAGTAAALQSLSSSDEDSSCCLSTGCQVLCYPCGMVCYALKVPFRVARLVYAILSAPFSLTRALVTSSPRVFVRKLAFELFNIAYRTAELASGILGIACPPLANFLEYYMARGYDRVSTRLGQATTPLLAQGLLFVANHTNRALGLGIDPTTFTHEYREPTLDESRDARLFTCFRPAWDSVVTTVKSQQRNSRETPDPSFELLIALFQLTLLEAAKNQDPAQLLQALTEWHNTTGSGQRGFVPLPTNQDEVITLLTNAKDAGRLDGLQKCALYTASSEDFKEAILPSDTGDNPLLDKLSRLFNAMHRTRQMAFLQSLRQQLFPS